MSEERVIIIDDLKRKYLVHLPEGYSSEKVFPVIFVLHGRTGSGKFMERLTGFSDLADEEGFFVVYPNGIEGQWNDDRPEIIYRKYKPEEVNDVKFLLHIFKELQNDFSIDSSGFFIAGISNGGMMGYRMGFEFPEKVKGLAVVSGGLPIPFQDGWIAVLISPLRQKWVNIW